VIHRTFTPLLRDGEVLHPDLAPTLLHRFSSREGYKAEPQVVASVKALRAEHDGCKKSDWFEQIVVGVITNSDDRVPDILSSLGFDVSPLRYGTAFDLATVAETQRSHDIDFHCMSYDVGVEKPDKRVFEAAEMMLAQVLETREGRGPDEPLADAAASWKKLYVGDEFAKDVVGAQNAGWKSILLVAKDGSENAGQHIDVPTIEESSGTSFKELFRDHSYATATSIQNVVSWIRGEERTPGR
jgi:FMN phosphatase YigB (HAD superfamily)